MNKTSGRAGPPAEGPQRRHPVVRAAVRVLNAYAKQQPELSFEVDFPGFGKKFGSHEPDFRVRFRSIKSVGHFLLSGGKGLGLEYLSGGVDVEGDLQSLLHVMNASSLLVKGHAVFTLLDELQNRFSGRLPVYRERAEDDRFSRFGNEFYRAWLDPGMGHSCASYENPEDDLESAQMNQYRNICRQLRLMKGQTLLDAACGWGGFLFYAAERFGARCTGVTLSPNQYTHVQEEIARRGLAGSVEVVLGGPDNIAGPFDRFVCVGMLGSPGPRHDRAFFRQTRKLLKPEGIGVLHTIGSGRGRQYHRWANPCVVPGASLPTLEKITGRMVRENLWVYDLEDLHHHSARTLDEWARRFELAVPSLEHAEADIRMWRLFLNACAMGFKAGDLRIYRVTFTPEKSARIPQVRKYIYANPMPA